MSHDETVWCDAHPGQHPLTTECRYPHYTAAGQVAAQARFKRAFERNPDVAVFPTTWTVSALPVEHPRWLDARIKVEYFPVSGEYLVRRLGYALNHEGGWDLEPTGGDADWFAEHAFANLDGATEAAKRAAAELAAKLT